MTKELLFPLQGGLSSVAYVKVDLVDINDNRPAFYPVSYAVSLSTQSAPGTSVVRVTAYDPDSGENGRITYKTVPGGASPYFTLNKDTGWHFSGSSLCFCVFSRLFWPADPSHYLFTRFQKGLFETCLHLCFFFRCDLPVAICLWQGQLCHSHADLCSGWWWSSCPRQCQSQH